ncbi:hypothetical protein [Vibrio parahaemolyticus]|nr:hypothetical protein [Vibrio parahaemolyticus]MBE3933001.1 hypothetical protein [Vibrio parahaemolyticus]MBE4044193.1 hypothetical protein [Vibrio parahaemolyticus]MCG6440013.1 hypothetical protein [Vibrio parahaemolyticus]MCG6455547.1 hypothetical protein [Vibrio parahaemolyticus]HCH1968196.1 hypothetical protein [Vibrio parahaemolyticus]
MLETVLAVVANPLALQVIVVATSLVVLVGAVAKTYYWIKKARKEA